MKPLEIYFLGRGEVKGFEFTQIAKSDKAYVYSKRTGDLVTYEVFEHKENKVFDCVSYPGSNSFGNWAWEYSERSKALEKFNELNVGQ